MDLRAAYGLFYAFSSNASALFNPNFLLLQLLLFLKGFSESERNKLAMLTGVLLANGTLNASILNSLYNENLVKEGN